MSGKQTKIRFTQQESQAQNFPGAAPAISVEQALVVSRAELRAIEWLLLSCNPHSPAAVLVGEFGLLLARLERGISITRGATLSLLVAAGKVVDRSELDRA